MTKNHLKTRSAPRTWNIARKEATFITRPNPGSQSLDMTLPLSEIMRTAGLAETSKEINFILRKNPVLVNGKRRWDRRFGVGFMDIVSVPDIKKHFMLTFDRKGRLVTLPIEEKNATTKLTQVRSTSTVHLFHAKKGAKAGTGKSASKSHKLQLHLVDGRNMLTDKPVAAGTTVVVDFAKNAITATHPVEPKAHVVLTAGKHRGTQGVIESIEGDFVTVKTKDATISTKKSYAFVLGELATVVAGASEHKTKHSKAKDSQEDNA